MQPGKQAPLGGGPRRECDTHTPRQQGAHLSVPRFQLNGLIIICIRLWTNGVLPACAQGYLLVVQISGKLNTCWNCEARYAV